MKALKMIHEKDPKEEIMERVASDLDEYTPLGAEVLIATYVRPQQTAGGLHLPDSYRKEDEFQGKVGLVLKMGPLAFREDDNHHFGEVVPKVGDWILLRVGDSFPFKLGEQHCRQIEDVNVKAILPAPDVVL